MLADHVHFRITIVEPRDYVENMYMNPRLLQEPENHRRTVHRLADLAWLDSCTVIQGRVTKLESTQATLSTGLQITFDFCIICCGARACPRL